MEITYGLVDEQGYVLNSVVVDSENLSVLDTLVQIHGAKAAHPFNLDTDYVIVGESRWNGVDWTTKKVLPEEFLYDATKESNI